MIRPAPVGAESGVPICSDLDGTLVKSNMLMETLAALLKQQPLAALAVPFWLLRGRARLKRELAKRVDTDASLLPYDVKLVGFLRGQHEAGRKIVLSTAADAIVANKIAAHLGIFDDVIASDGQTNVKGETKAAILVKRFGERGYDFVGEDRFDMACWHHAHGAIVVGNRAGVRRKLEAMDLPQQHIERDGHPVRAFFRALRAYQWAKNLLLLVPLVTAHRLFDDASAGAALLAFLAFSLVASAVYVANDLLDLEDDRRHRTKRARPFAAGELDLALGFVLVPVLAIAAGIIASWLPPAFGALVGAYVAANLAYSMGLKRLALVDVFVLAAFYALRILAGAAAIDVPVSHWLLAFSLFIFLSLALAKRFVEVSNVAARDEARVGGRGYLAGDAALLGWLGTASGYLSVLVFALYITSREVVALYTHPAVLWFACPLLLYWVSRVWLLAQRRELHEDPLLFALHDPQSYVVGLGILAAIIAAT